MCPVRRGSPKLLLCCLCYNWRHAGCSYQTHLGRVCPCHVQILDSKRKIIIVLRHPYHEDYVVLPTRTNMRVDNKSIAQERSRPQPDDASLSRWSPSQWLNTLLEKHAWFSAGLVWVQGASMSDDSPPGDSDPRPTINLFEYWEEGAHMPKVANARDYSFPKSLVVPFTWLYAPKALSLSDAINGVSQHDERNTWGQASRIKLVPGINYPNQPRCNPGSHLSDPLTYWLGVTLCPPELNDVALAETVVILMRYAAIKEINLNIEATPHEETCIYSSVLEGGTLMQKFEEGELQDAAADGDKGNDQGYPIRSEGGYATSSNPWPRDEQREARDITGVQKRKPYTHRRQGNRWDQYGESSSAASSEPHIMSDYAHSESTRGPYESAHRDKRAAQPYRLQMANRSEGQRSRWASDIRQSQPD